MKSVKALAQNFMIYEMIVFIDLWNDLLPPHRYVSKTFPIKYSHSRLSCVLVSCSPLFLESAKKTNELRKLKLTIEANALMSYAIVALWYK